MDRWAQGQPDIEWLMEPMPDAWSVCQYTNDSYFDRGSQIETAAVVAGYNVLRVAVWRAVIYVVQQKNF